MKFEDLKQSPIGFIGDYSKFEKVETNDGLKTFRYASDRIKTGTYKKVILDPVDYYPKAIPSKQVTNKLLEETKMFIDKEFAAAIPSSIEVVKQPQEGAMRVTPRITAIKTSTGDIELKEMIPIGSVIALGRAAAGYRHQNVEIYMEIKATDSLDGEIIGGSVKQGKSAEISGSNSVVSLDDLKPLLSVWVKDAKDTFGRLGSLPNGGQN